MGTMSLIKVNNLIKYVKNNTSSINIVLTTILSAVFVGIAENQRELFRSIFLYPGAIFIYLHFFLSKPHVLALYIATIVITKKYSHKLINNI